MSEWRVEHINGWWATVARRIAKLPKLEAIVGEVTQIVIGKDLDRE